MSESMSSPWIRDYLTGVAETRGAQFYNTPVTAAKKKVQLTDFLTYQENSYVWAWISDKDHRVSVRISKDAVDEYKRTHSRDIIDSRFSLVFISRYRPMFCPRPLGPNATGNTPVSHISLEIGQVKSMGMGGHLFGNPRDLESDENIKEWVLGLRQDGGGGNVLKLRKQQEPVQNKNGPPSPPSPPPFSLYAPVSQYQTTKAAEATAKPKPERPQDRKRVYAKRWRINEANPWKFAFKPAAEERPNQTESSHSLVESRLDTPSRLEPRHRALSRQGTPTDWSLSNRGSPVAPDKATAFGNGIRRHDEPEFLPTTPCLPSDTEGHTTVNTAITSDTHSLQPPTPAQRIKRSPPPRSTSPPRSCPEVFARSPPLPSQQLPCSSPPPPSSSLPLPLSSLPMPTNIRKNIQRKVPHPALPVSRPDPSKQGPIQILVPNSDTGTGSSQSYSQSQHPSQSQQPQPSHSPTFPSSTHPVGRTEDKVQEKASPAHVQRHDSEAWKEPSFLARNKGKGKAREELDTPSVKVGEKRRRSAQPESPVPKRAKVFAPEVRREASDQPRDIEASANGKIHSSNRPSTSPRDTTAMTIPSTAFQLSKPRLANLVVDFERIDLGKRVPIPMEDMDKDIKSMLLRTGRIRALGEDVEKDGSVYIMK